MAKQYLMLCDDMGMEALKRVFKECTVQFLEVQGMNLNAENRINLLVTPVLAPVPPAFIPPPVPVQPAPPQGEPPVTDEVHG